MKLLEIRLRHFNSMKHVIVNVVDLGGERERERGREGERERVMMLT
jgi:hypothetical protein